MPAGYSKRPLVQKLGIKEGFRVRILNPPAGYERTLGKLPDGVTVAGATRGTFDFVHLFAKSRKELEAKFSSLKRALDQAGMLWVSWPKKASSVTTDLTEDVVRGVGLKNGLVDVKVCAVDETWSGLKFVIRLKDRAAGKRQGR